MANEELPGMDINHRSAVSLARRVVDPLAELCKIEPESLGVGMYQHDMDKNVLSNELRKCVESCVAKVGVDLTTCSASLLQYVPGVGPVKAKKIIDYREGKLAEVKSGRKNKLGKTFLSKKDLCNVPGIGEKLLKQAAGFVYISNAPKLVDRIAHIHPDALPIIEFMQKTYGGEDVPELELEHNQLHFATVLSFVEELSKRSSNQLTKTKVKGTKRKIDEVEINDAKPAAQDTAAEFYNIEIVKDVVNELQMKVEDVRKAQPKPQKIDLDTKQKTIENVKIDDVFSGTVRNIVQFGAFVDINIGVDALLHSSQLKRLPYPLQINQTLKVKILSKELRGTKHRISLAPA